MPEPSAPTISVIVPAYNCGRYLGEALDSVLAQTLPPHQVIVVDDGSTDDTPARCAAYGDRITYVRQENKGVAAARNTALELARGEYVALLDADDVCTPDRLAKQAAALRANPDAVACCTGFWVFCDDGRVLNAYPADPRDGERPALDYYWFVFGHPISMVFDRRAATGLTFPAGVRLCEDRMFLTQLRRRGRFVLLPDALYGYRRRDGQITSRFTEIEGYEALLKWARANPAVWPDKTPEEVEAGMWGSLAHYTEVHYWARRRQQFLTMRAYLRANWPARLPPHRVLRRRWYPDWLWSCKDRFDRLRTRFTSQTGNGAGPKRNDKFYSPLDPSRTGSHE